MTTGLGHSTRSNAAGDKTAFIKELGVSVHTYCYVLSAC
jgi:hypothetical protein